MADILTFRLKDSSMPDECFLEERDKTLSFRKTPEGHFDLDTVKFPAREKKTAQISRDWSNQELATLFRVKHILDAAGIVSETERGLSDEGDPWFVFCHEDGNVFIHFCRIDGLYVLDSPNLNQPLRGHDFEALISDFTRREVPSGNLENGTTDNHRVVRLERGGKVRLHPSTLLAALVWTLFLDSEDLVLLVKDTGDDGQNENPSSDELIAFGGVTQQVSIETHTAAEVQTNADGPSVAQEPQIVASGQTTATPKEMLSQTGLAIIPNSYVVGLSSIAIALGLISEHSLSETAQNIVVDMEKALAFLSNSSVEKDDSPALPEAGAIEDAFLHLVNFLDDAFSENTNGEELSAVLEDGQNSGDAIFILAGKGEIKTVSNSKIVIDIPEEDLRVPLEDAGDFHEHIYLLPKGEVGSNDKNLAMISAENIEELLQIWKTPLESFVMGGQKIFASFDILDIPLIELGYAISDNPNVESGSTFEIGTTTGSLAPLPVSAGRSIKSLIDTALSISVATENKSAFGEEAADFVHFLLSRIDSIEVIRTDRDYVFLDSESFLGGQGEQLHVMSWSLDDGGVVATIGLRSDFDSYDMIA
ncbi:hypothetical protein [uncultured Marivita sp.]|uniref:hypothetical protein n=1 Tax=uncultured Marivita sp. TaxID=888080 RepID=UPI002626FC99|nr:hypothetical protein [uncultured Marivita sp.]